MESIDQVIGEDRALELRFDSRNRQLSAEDWTAYLRALEFDENDELIDDSELIASARLVRVRLLEADWLDSLDAESEDLEVVGAALADRDRLADLDEASVFSNSLVVIDFISVAEEHRGSRVSEAFIRGIGHIFRDEIIALIPADLSTDRVHRRSQAAGASPPLGAQRLRARSRDGRDDPARWRSLKCTSRPRVLLGLLLTQESITPTVSA